MKKLVIKDKDKFIRNTKKISCILLLGLTFLLIHIISPILANTIKEMEIEPLTNIIFVIMSILSIWFIFFTDLGGDKNGKIN